MEPIKQVINPLLTRLIGSYGKLKKGLDQILTEPLIRIPESPKSYMELKCALYGIQDINQWNQTFRKFQDKFKEFSSLNGEYIKELLRIRDHNWENAEHSLAQNNLRYLGEGTDPIERIEIIEYGRKTDILRWMLLVDFDFNRSGNKLYRYKIYTPLRPESFFNSGKEVKYPGWLIPSIEKAKRIQDRKERLPYKDN